MFKKILIGLVVLIVAAVIATVMSINTIAKKAIETGGSAALGTEVTVSSVNISLLSQSVRINGLTIANPEGFTDKNFLSIGTFAVQGEDLLSNPILIDSILISGIDMNVEITKSGSNVKKLTSKMKSAEKSGGSTEETSGEGGEAKKLVIRDLKITDSKVSATLPMAGKTEQDLPDIHMTDLGTEEQAIEPPEAVRRVMAKLNEAALDVSQGSLKDQIKQKLQDKLGGSSDGGSVTDSIKGIFGK